MDFESSKQIQPETGDVLNLYYEINNAINSKILVESHLTGGKFSIPDIHHIPWPIQEMMKLATLVSRNNEALKRIPKTDGKTSPEAYSKAAEAKNNCENDWQAIISYANNLDIYFRTVGKEVSRG